MTIKQEKFCNKYIECGNASEAYRFAYDCKNMKDETVNNKAYSSLQKGEIRARITELQSELKLKSDITKEEILSDLNAIRQAKITDYVEFDGLMLRYKDFSTLTEDQVKAVESIKQGPNGIELKLHGKSWTMDRICKMLGFDAPEKKEITGELGFASILMETGIINDEVK